MSVAPIVLRVCNKGRFAGTGGRQFGPSMGAGRAAACLGGLRGVASNPGNGR
jgi:hypothetical protein